MTDIVPDHLKDEFSQDAWSELTDEERAGMLEEGQEDETSQDEIIRQEEEDAAREDAAVAAAAQQQQQQQQQQKEPTEEERQAAADAAAATTTTTKPEEQQEPEKPAPTPRPRGVVDAKLPDDYDAKVKANEEALTDLEKKYDDGDLSFAEFRKEQRRLDRESRDLEKLADRAELAEETAYQAMVNQWVAIINPFTAAHPELSASPEAMAEFDTFLRVVNNPVQQAGNMPGQNEIDKAYRLWCASTGFTPTAGQQQQQQTTQQKQTKVPPVLGGLPSASQTSVDDGRLAAINRLEGVEFDEAFARLTPEEQERLSMYG